ncbi:dTDP-4-dehydrorhamnose 3,5-epimerase [Polaromonas sp. YR568]|uniref:dTDP-4-dehydrorhamnose 3,5-epimerase n=1 Tax=Polaromonas sp. YR568 TaxID=1855301 RepID=UPI003137DDDA
MRVLPTTVLPEVLIVEPRVFNDSRGLFFESFNQREFNELTATDLAFVQDNHSRSTRSVLRGLHFQIKQPQGKLIRVISGAIFDVAVDIRRSSPTYKHWVGVELTAQNYRQLWIPPGFAHGFVVLGDHAECLYKSTAYYDPSDQGYIRWDDPSIAIDWPLSSSPVLSDRDSTAPSLIDCDFPN